LLGLDCRYSDNQASGTTPNPGWVFLFSIPQRNIHNPLYQGACMSIRILLVDDHHQYRRDLRTLLDQAPDLTIVAEAVAGSDALQRVGEAAPDLVLMDVALPGMSGIEATRLILVRFPNVKVLALSLYDDLQFVSAIIEAGARGYVLKDGGVQELIQAIRIVTSGGSYFSPELGITFPE
jgi:DNA-binding NarL/FixJ family response regulator